MSLPLFIGTREQRETVKLNKDCKENVIQKRPVCCFFLTKSWSVMACLTARPEEWSTVMGSTTLGGCGLTGGNFSLLIVTMLWSTTHAAIILQSLSGATLRLRRQEKRAFTMPKVISILVTRSPLLADLCKACMLTFSCPVYPYVWSIGLMKGGL